MIPQTRQIFQMVFLQESKNPNAHIAVTWYKVIKNSLILKRIHKNVDIFLINYNHLQNKKKQLSFKLCL